MKDIRIALILLFLGLLCINAQSKRFYYNLHFKKNAVDTVYSKDILVLEINKKSNVFLSDEYIVSDSLNKVNKDNQSFAYPKFKNVVEYRQSDKSFNFINNLSMNYYQFNAKKEINWKIVNDKKKIGNFEVIRATTNYGGRNWTAWYCSEISLPYGPYVFYGLPGLILEIYDDEYNFHFSFIQNKNYNIELNSSDIIKNLFNDRKVDIKEKDWQKVQLNYYNNPIPEYKSGKAFITKDSGEQYGQNEYRELEKAIQNQIKKFNNPIELDKTVHYPEN